MSKVIRWTTPLCALILTTGCWGDSGTLLQPGTQSVDPINLTDSPGTLLASTTSSLTSRRGTFQGTLISAVYQNQATNGLDFYLQLVNGPRSRESITLQNHGGFEGWTTSVGFRTDGAALGDPFLTSGLADPSMAVRSQTGGTVAFVFQNNRIQPGTASRILVIQTNARFYQQGTTSIVDAGVATGNTFAPSSEEGGYARDTGALTLTTGWSTLSVPADLTLGEPVPAVSLLPRVVQGGGATDVSDKVRVTQSGFTRNRSTGFWVATLTVKNISFASIPGPIEVVFNNLPLGVTLVNASGIYNGSPYITVTDSSLPAGTAASVVLEFNNPSMGFITYMPATYSGTLAAPVCTPTGAACTLNNSSACCSGACGFNGGNPRCCTLDNGPFSCFGPQ